MVLWRDAFGEMALASSFGRQNAVNGTNKEV